MITVFNLKEYLEKSQTNEIQHENLQKLNEELKGMAHQKVE